MDQPLIFAFMLTLIAGLATGIGGATAFFLKPGGKGFLSASLGFSAGVMLYISFVEILPDARAALHAAHGSQVGNWIAIAGFFAGILIITIIDYFIPAYENPHETCGVGDSTANGVNPQLLRLGVVSMLVISIHNFPEGVATLFAGLKSPSMGISIALAIALHNIPEGICISVPMLGAGKSRTKAFLYSLIAGLAEPVGALIGYLVLRPFLSASVLGFVFAAVAGIMVFISLDQLIPNAKKLGSGHQSVYGLIAGMAVIALSAQLLH